MELDYHKNYYKKHKNYYKEYHRQRYIDNKDKILIRQKAYNEKNRVNIKKYQSNYYQKMKYNRNDSKGGINIEIKSIIIDFE